MRGVPLRLEIGPKDIEKASVFAARRDTRAKQSLPMEGLAARVTALLDEIQGALLERARAFRDSHTTAARSYDEFKSILDGRPGFVQAPWCGSAQCEAEIKAETQATIRNIPFGFDQAPGVPCIKCNGDAIATAWFAKAY
jgi:prolyl-tRNA synthetase